MEETLVRRPNGLNRIAKFRYGHLCLMEETLVTRPNGLNRIAKFRYGHLFDGGNLSKKTKWPKQDSQIQVWSPMFEGGNLSFNNNYMI